MNEMMIPIKEGIGAATVIMMATSAILGVIILFGANSLRSNGGKQTGAGWVFFVGALLCLIPLTIGAIVYFVPGGHKAEERETTKNVAEKLTEKLEKITDLRESIEKKRTEVVNLKAQFVDGIRSLKVGIDARREAENIKTYSQAMNDQQIKNSLSLMQSKIAYKERLQEIENKLTSAHYDLQYIENKTTDDLKMSRVLSKEEMNRIVGQIEQVITKYAPETKKLVINEADIKIKSTENIWDLIEKEPKPTTTVYSTSTTVRPISTTTVRPTSTTTVRPRPTTTVYSSSTTVYPTSTTTIYPESTTTVLPLYPGPTTTVLPLYREPRVIYPPVYPGPVIIYPRPKIVYPGPIIIYPWPRRIYPGQPNRRY